MSNLPEPYGVLFTLAPEFDKDVPEDATAAIKLLEPLYKDIVVRYNTVKFTESDDKESALLSFDYDIISGSVPEKLKADFEVTLGNLLHDVLLQSISND